MNKPKKLLYFDVETTGLYHGIDSRRTIQEQIQDWKNGKAKEVNEIIQISGIIEWDGKEVDRFDFRVKPRNWDMIDQEALKVTGLTIEELEKYPDPKLVFLNLKKVFDRHINKYDKNDKFIPVAHNGRQFDMNFLLAFFIEHEDPYFGAWLSWNMLDTMGIAQYLFIMSNIPIANFKLETLCGYFGIPLKAHDSMNDIVATRQLLYKMNEVILGQDHPSTVHE